MVADLFTDTTSRTTQRFLPPFVVFFHRDLLGRQVFDISLWERDSGIRVSGISVYNKNRIQVPT